MPTLIGSDWRQICGQWNPLPRYQPPNAQNRSSCHTVKNPSNRRSIKPGFFSRLRDGIAMIAPLELLPEDSNIPTEHEGLIAARRIFTVSARAILQAPECRHGH